MSTRSSARDLFPPLDNPELTIRSKSRTDPTLLNDSEMAAEGPSALPVLDLRTMEELCQPSLNGRGGPIAPIAIQATNFGLKNDMIKQSIKVNGVTDDTLHLYLFPHSLTHHATTGFDRLPRNSINTFEQMATMFLDTFYNGLTLRHRDTINAAAGGTFMKKCPKECYDLIKNMTAHHNDWDTSVQRRPTIPTTSSSLPPIVERETEATNDMVHPTNNESTEDVQPPVVQTESPILNSEPVIAPIIKPVASPVSAPEPNQRPLIPLLTNKDKLYELARTPLNEHCSVVLLKKFPEKLEDPDQFLIPCDFPGMAECLALADLGASINLMPLSVWNKLSLPDLSPTCMTLELTNHLISRSVGVAKDVFDKVGTFRIPADFIVVDFNANPRIPLILGRSFLKTRRALIDVFEGELTLRVGKEAITFNLDQTLRYSANYNDMTANRIDIIDMDCEKYSQEVLDFSDMIASVNPTPYYDLIVSITSSTLTPFGNKAFLNDDPSLPPPNQGNYLPQVRKELKICEAKTDKSSIDEPLEVELKDLPPYLEYIFLEGGDKFPVITAKDLSIEEKTALITTSNQRFNIKEGSILKSMMSSRIRYFQIPIDLKDQEKTIFTCPYGTFAYRRMPFGLCNAPGTFQRCIMVVFHDMIEKTIEVFMDDLLVFRNSFQTCLSHLERMLKRCEDIDLCLNWEKSHFMVKEGIVPGHKIFENGIEVDKAKVNFIAKLPHPTTVKDTKGAENLVADHLSRLENPHQNALDPKEINESFPLETLNLVSSRGNSSTPWFADFANYHAGNFVVKGMSSQQKNKFFKDVKHYFWDDPFLLKSVRIKSSQGVYTARKPLTFSRLATIDPSGDIMAQTTQPKRCLIQDSIGQPFTVMPKT
nr:hypothetical protein [Tanacetum cinerariifolium]